MEHEFTSVIKGALVRRFKDLAEEIFEKSHLIKYLNYKTKSANRGSKSRSSFANHYALYVLVEDYVLKNFADGGDSYSDYEGAVYTELFTRMKELPFGSKLQNHALNSRLNDEFRKFFPEIVHQPIVRDLQTKRYWINENLLKVKVAGEVLNIAPALIEIIDLYIEAKKSAFNRFITYSTKLARVSGNDVSKAVEFITQQIQPNVDARIFEIVSYSILKSYYADTVLYWGWERDKLTEESLKLYKTGRTNANDGGIDFVMKPLGRFFQVTETLDVKKYFLDIDKIQRYPVTFVIKTDLSKADIYHRLEINAQSVYGVKMLVRRYMDSVEEVINIPKLTEILKIQVGRKKVREIMKEIVLQSKREFNHE